MKFQPDKQAEIIVTMNGQGASITPRHAPTKPKPPKQVIGHDEYAEAARAMLSFYFREGPALDDEAK